MIKLNIIYFQIFVTFIIVKFQKLLEQQLKSIIYHIIRIKHLPTHYLIILKCYINWVILTMPQQCIKKMTFEFYREYCLRKPFVTEGFPFDASTHVLKVGGKMFALSDIDNFTGINLKADPERSIDLRERYMGIQPGWHMNKTHWNTVSIKEDVSDELILELIDHSYSIIYNSLPKKVRNELEMG